MDQIAGDIGGTKSIFHHNGQIKSYLNRDFTSFSDLLGDLIEYFDIKVPFRLCLAIAAPVLDDEIKMTNLDWVLHREKIKKDFKAQDVLFLNDLVAVGQYITRTIPLKYIPLKPGGYKRTNNSMLVIGIGTGLGISLVTDNGHERTFIQEDPLVPVDTTRSYNIHPTEAGHSKFAPNTEFERQLVEYLGGEITVEDVISSKGLANIYQVMVSGTDIEEPEHHRKLSRSRDPVSTIIKDAKGRQPCNICRYVISYMVESLARYLQDLCLQYLPLQGIFLFGGIVSNITSYLGKTFVKAFLQVDGDDHHSQNLKRIIHTIPIYLITENNAAVLGAEEYAKYKYRDE